MSFIWVRKLLEVSCHSQSSKGLRDPRLQHGRHTATAMGPASRLELWKPLWGVALLSWVSASRPAQWPHFWGCSAWRPAPRFHR